MAFFPVGATVTVLKIDALTFAKWLILKQKLNKGKKGFIFKLELWLRWESSSLADCANMGNGKQRVATGQMLVNCGSGAVCQTYWFQ